MYNHPNPCFHVLSAIRILILMFYRPSEPFLEDGLDVTWVLFMGFPCFKWTSWIWKEKEGKTIKKLPMKMSNSFRPHTFEQRFDQSHERDYNSITLCHCYFGLEFSEHISERCTKIYTKYLLNMINIAELLLILWNMKDILIFEEHAD